MLEGHAGAQDDIGKRRGGTGAHDKGGAGNFAFEVVMGDLGEGYCGKQGTHLGRGGIGDGGGFDYDFVEEGGQRIGKGGDAEGKREVDDWNIVRNGQAAISDDKGISVAKARNGTGERGIKKTGLTPVSYTHLRAHETS